MTYGTQPGQPIATTWALFTSPDGTPHSWTHEENFMGPDALEQCQRACQAVYTDGCEVHMAPVRYVSDPGRVLAWLNHGGRS